MKSRRSSARRVSRSGTEMALDVSGDVRASGSVLWGWAGSRTETKNDAAAQASKSGFFETAAPLNYYTGASSWQHLIEARHSNDANNYALQIAGSFFDQELYFRKTNGSGTTAWNKVVYANSSGNVGIGTSSPRGTWHTRAGANQNLVVVQDGNGGDAGATGLISINDANSAWSPLHFQASRFTLSQGNVGIGTTVPFDKLTVNGMASFFTTINDHGVRIIADPTNTHSKLQFTDYARNTEWGSIHSFSTGAMVLNASGGNVGIGTTAPGQTLTVAGTIESTSRGIKFPDGTTQTTAAMAGGGGAANYQEFNASGTWTKPAAANLVRVQCWGAGGSGSKSGQYGAGSGGGGGGYNENLFLASNLTPTVTVSIGSGGASVSAAYTDGNAGGNSSFGSYLVAYGGGGGSYSSGGGGGGQTSAGSTNNIGLPGGPLLDANQGEASGHGGWGYDDGVSGPSPRGAKGGFWHGGGGGLGLYYVGATPGAGSVFGGGGGGSTDQGTSRPGGSSAYGGNGGSGGDTGVAGSQPGGGGGGSRNGTSGAGGAGRCRVMAW